MRRKSEFEVLERCEIVVFRILQIRDIEIQLKLRKSGLKRLMAFLKTF